MIDYILWLLFISAVLFVVIGLWIGIYYWLSPHVENPDGKARITGSCGDTMEIGLKFKRDRVAKTAHWTDGCAYSLNCVCSAADLAKGRTPDEILEIDTDLIQRSVGGLPSDHLHCARLAAETLQAALEDYMLKSKEGKPNPKSAR
jgi:NifU-like protein involved in Fe-S cluster formation